MRAANLGPTPAQTQERDNVVTFPSQLERDIAALWRTEAQLREQAARFKTIEELREIYALRQRIIPWLLKYPQFNPDPDPVAPMSDADITKMLIDHPDPKWREAGRTGKWRRTTADDVTRRDDSRDVPEVVPFTAKAKKAKAKPERPPRDLPPWLQACEKDGRDQIIPNLANLMIALRGDPDLANTLAFDQMLQSPVLRSPLPPAPNGKTTGGGDPLPRPLRDADVSDLREYVQHYGFPRISRDISHEAADKRARELSFHPVRRWLDGLVWDGTPRLDGWLAKYLGSASNREYLSAIGPMFLISMVARIYEPGCKVDYMLVFEGPQGETKSQVCAIIAGEWFSDDLPDLHTKDVKQHLRGKWLIEIAELSAFSRAETEALKAFITRTDEKYRPPYGRLEVNEPRQCVFIGTTNKENYLKDDTGARRFWPVNVGKIDLKGLRRDRDQLFAEAVMRFRRGDHWWPEAAFELRVIRPEQEGRYEADVWEEAIREYLKGQSRVTVTQIARLALGFDTIAKVGTADQRRIAAVLKTLGGWKPGKDYHGRFYERT